MYTQELEFLNILKLQGVMFSVVYAESWGALHLIRPKPFTQFPVP